MAVVLSQLMDGHEWCFSRYIVSSVSSSINSRVGSSFGTCLVSFVLKVIKALITCRLVASSSLSVVLWCFWFVLFLSLLCSHEKCIGIGMCINDVPRRSDRGTDSAVVGHSLVAELVRSLRGEGQTVGSFSATESCRYDRGRSLRVVQWCSCLGRVSRY